MIALKCLIINLFNYPSLYLCINLSDNLMTGVFPDRLKYAIILPIHNKGDKLIMSNYRLVSLLLSCSKILETIMFNRLYQYVHTNDILAPEQRK